VLLQKTLFNIEGLGRRLYPELDLWETAKPFLEKWTREQYGPRALLRTLKRELPRWLRALPESPGTLFEILRKTGRGELEIRWRSQELERLRRELRGNHRRLWLAVVGGSLVISAALLAGGPAPHWLGVSVWTWVLGLSGAGLVALAWPGRRMR
jgi:ubiquinone biosynthesis protein